MNINSYLIFRFLNKFTNYHKSNHHKSIIIFSIPRSGSTWLQQLVLTQKKVKYCNEPLNIRNTYVRKLTHINSWEQLYNIQNKTKVITYLKDFCHGKNRWLNPSPFRNNFSFFTNRMVFKVINGAELWINDIARECNGTIVYLLRHPISTSLSRKKTPRLEVLCREEILNNFKDKTKQIALETLNNGDLLSKAVLSWCIQTKLALLNDTTNWVFVTYEQLVIDPNPVIDKLVIDLNLQNKERIVKALNIPSKVSIQSTKERIEMINKKSNDNSLLVSSWKEKVNTDLEKKLFRIVEGFELNHIYSYGSIYSNKEFIVK